MWFSSRGGSIILTIDGGIFRVDPPLAPGGGSIILTIDGGIFRVDLPLAPRGGSIILTIDGDIFRVDPPLLYMNRLTAFSVCNTLVDAPQRFPFARQADNTQDGSRD